MLQLPNRLVVLAGTFLVLGVFIAQAPSQANGDELSRPTRQSAQGPKAISDAERRAAELVLLFFDEGVRSWWPHLSTNSPLRTLGEAEAAAEISVRLGPSEGAEWQLLTAIRDPSSDTAVFAVSYPSGMDDLIELRLIDEEGAWRLHQVKSMADPRSPAQTIGDQLSGAALNPMPSNSDRRSPSQQLPLILLSLLVLCRLISNRLNLRLTRRRFQRHRFQRHHELPSPALPICVVSLLIIAGCDRVPFDSIFDELDKEPSGTIDPSVIHSLAPLQSLRLALSSSEHTEDATLQTLIDRLDLDAGAKEVATSWLAQRLIILGRLKQARDLLDVQPSPSTLPITELLRARLDWFQSRSGDVFTQYQRALARAPDQDFLKIEAATAFIRSGDDLSAESIFEQLLTSGSRTAEIYYLASRFATLDDRHEDADQLFITGWNLEPISRATLFSDPLLSHSATRPNVFNLFNFSSVEEPIVHPSDLGSRALNLPGSGMESRLLGGTLTVVSDPQGSPGSSATPASATGNRRAKTLVLPGGSALAPPDVTLESAEASERRDVELALSQLETLTEQGSRQGGLAHPARQQLARTAASALAESNRWPEVLELTQTVSDDSQGISPDLIKLRARALMEEEFEIEAKNLMIELAKSDLANSRRDPGTYYQMAEMFAKTEDYERALRLLKKAESLSPYPINPGRAEQIELDRDLSQQYVTRETDHFLLLYPELTGPKYPKHLGWVLEAEWRRLQKWIPTTLPKGEKIEVHLIPLEPFMQAYSRGVMVLGIYDGRVRVPLADLRSLDPLLVGILSHEVAHAMIDIHTEGKAPKWLHEGLASHIEMEQPGINPIPDMHKLGRDLTFPIIEPVLAGFSEPQLVELAYSHATWALHYVESRHGVRGIHRLLKAFRRGGNTEQALREAFGQTIQQFDAAWREWCISKAPDTWPTRLVHYEEAFDTLVNLGGDRGLSDADVASLTESRGMPSKPHRASSTTQAPPQTKRPPKSARDRQARDPKARDQNALNQQALKQQVKAWHVIYKRNVLPVKRQLKTTMALIQGKAQGDMIGECSGLGESLSALTRHPQALKAPSSQARKALEQAYGHFLSVATACQNGDMAQVKGQLGKASQALNRAQQDLRRFGVTP